MRPMLASPGPPPEGEQWLHEVKWDGMRVIADVGPDGLHLFSRSGRDVTTGFPELHTLAGSVRDAVIDGEIIVLDQGIPSFAALAERMQVSNRKRVEELAERSPVTVMAFDLVRLYGVPLLDRPLAERRKSLGKLELPEDHWRASPSYDDGPALFAATLEQGLEGVVAKRRRSTYQPGRRSRDWIKTPHRRHQACVVGGWRKEGGDRPRIGALLIGVPDATGHLHFAGRVGSGLTGAVLDKLNSSFAPTDDDRSPFVDAVPDLDGKDASWVRPLIVVEVRHLGWTAGGRLRQPVFRGIRTDLSPQEVRRES